MTLIMVSTVCILPILLVLTVREPPRPVFVATDTVKSPTPPFREAVRFLLDRRGFYGFLYLGFGLPVIAVFAVPAWAPTWLVRQYGLPFREFGVRFGIVSLVSGSLGMWCVPFFGRLLARSGYVAAARAGVGRVIGLFPFSDFDFAFLD